MSDEFDFAQFYEAAKDDIDAETIARIQKAHTAAVDAAVREAEVKTAKASERALECVRGQLESLEAQAIAKSAASAQSTSKTLRATRERAHEDMRQVEQNVASMARSVALAVNEAQETIKQTRAAVKTASDATALMDRSKAAAEKEINALRMSQDQSAKLLRKAQMFLIVGAVLALLGLSVAGWIGALIGNQAASDAYAVEFARLGEIAQAQESRIAELALEEEMALTDAYGMVTRRDEIRAELERIVELREDIGFELVRDDRVVEIRLGDVMLRPWRGRTLVIVDEGRKLEAFGGGAALNDIYRYRGRMFQTQAVE
jgi:hypothetical protein